MRVEYFRTFQRVIQLKSFSAAARSLHISQSTASQQVKEVEKFFDAVLIVRGQGPIRLTEVGERVLPHVEACLQKIDDAIKATYEETKSNVRISMGADTAEYVLPLALEPFIRKHPGISFAFQTMQNRESIVRQVMEHRADIGLIYRDQQPLPRELEAFAPPGQGEEIVLVTAPSHHWARMRSITTEELLAEHLILQTKHSVIRRLLDEEMSRRGRIPLQSMELSTNEAVKAAVRLGLGAGFLPISTVKAGLIDGTFKVIDVEDLKIWRHWTFIHLKGVDADPRIQKLFHHLRTQWPERIAM